LERATGIEPAFSAWEADVLPLNYARERHGTLAGARRRASAGIAEWMRENLVMAYLPQRDLTEVIGRRISAFVVDTLLVSGVSVALFAVLKTNSYTGAPSDACQQLRDLGISDPCVQLGSHVYTWTGGRFALAIALAVLVSLVNHVLLQGMTGASVGKMMLGLRVVDAGGRVCGVGRAIVRWLFLIVDQFFCFLVGLIIVLVTHPHRRVGDMVAGTYVVSTADAGRPVVPLAAMPPYAYAGQGGWTPPAPGTPTWGAPPPPATWGAPPPPVQPTWGTQPRAWGTEPPPTAPYQPSPPASPPPPETTPSPGSAPPSWGTPPPPPATPAPPVPSAPGGPEAAPEDPERRAESWWDKALGDETKPDDE
jgi:uncharacterized RDD family membrane protein YckC